MIDRQDSEEGFRARKNGGGQIQGKAVIKKGSFHVVTSQAYVNVAPRVGF